MNKFEELGRVVAELAMIKRHLKNVSDKFLELHKNNRFAEYEMVNSQSYVDATKSIKELQSRKIKLLNKCKKEIKKEKVEVVVSTEVQGQLIL